VRETAAGLILYVFCVKLFDLKKIRFRERNVHPGFFLCVLNYPTHFVQRSHYYRFIVFEILHR